MMIGEINYESVFNNPDEPLEYPEVTYILLIAFLIFMSILIMNLLVGLAVDDIKVVQEQAMLQKLAMQTELVLDIEMVIPDFIRRKHMLQEMKVNNDRKRGVLGLLLSKLNLHQGREVSEIEELRKDMQQLKQAVNSLMEVTSSLNDLAVLKASVGDLGQLTARLASNIQSNQQASSVAPTTPSSETGIWQNSIDF
ncbi:hypothetical protein SK128_014797 [Halocaridina rubra]|uniref:Ion transport domain-containing protein n=1 Tax=Halocaridina rubra TaxID=373956 RepID=A0AAN9A877_HALRR